jgi:hypothetical protein
MTTINPTLIKEQVTVAGLLARLGFQPAKPAGPELVYHSMLREGDRTPSFSVNDTLGVWYDHGTGKGGNVIDFGLAYWPGLSFREVLTKIWETAQLAVPFSFQPAVSTSGRRRKALKLPHYQVENVKPLASMAICQYLDNRGLLDIAPQFLKEVHYYVEDETHKFKHFFAAGHQNELGGWEVRNKHFKGCLGRKALTLIAGIDRRLAIFEGYFDYLSWRHEQPNDHTSVLVLNSLSLLEQGLRIAMAYPHIDCFFDHDKAGRAATRRLLQALPYASDRSAYYKGYNDYNDKRKAEASAARAKHQPKDLFKNIKVPFIR